MPYLPLPDYEPGNATRNRYVARRRALTRIGRNINARIIQRFWRRNRQQIRQRAYWREEQRRVEQRLREQIDQVLANRIQAELRRRRHPFDDDLWQKRNKYN